jgi:putative toxin-antitoxin system antitoxin component (TIGR02293 family)
MTRKLDFNESSATELLPRISSLLGGRRALGFPAKTPLDFSYAVLRGLPYTALKAFARNTRLGAPVLSKHLRIDERELADIIRSAPTADGRGRSASRYLDAEISDRLYQLARMVASVERMLGDRRRAIRWITRASTHLGGVRPLDLCRTEPGRRFLEEAIVRIEHGMLA